MKYIDGNKKQDDKEKEYMEYWDELNTNWQKEQNATFKPK